MNFTRKIKAAVLLAALFLSLAALYSQNQSADREETSTPAEIIGRNAADSTDKEKPEPDKTEKQDEQARHGSEPAKRDVSTYSKSDTESKESEDSTAIKRNATSAKKTEQKWGKQSGGIVITATRTEIDKRETGASVTIITEEEIKESGKDMVSGVLSTIPGMDVVKNGSLGGVSNVMIRGASSKNVLVLIDGVPVNDPIGGGGDKLFDFANLPTENIERIEIIRGPSSVIYGSESAAGVINIITKTGSGKPEVKISVEGGSFLTFKETAALTAGNETVNFSFAASRLDSEGISKRANPDGSVTNLENDPYHNTGLSSRTKIKLFGNSTIDFNVHYINSEAGVDDYEGDNPYHNFYSELFSTGLTFSQSISFWNHKLALSHISSKTKDINDRPDGIFSHSYFDGNNQIAEWLNNFNIDSSNAKDTITLGVSGSREAASSISDADASQSWLRNRIPEKEIGSLGIFLQNHLKLFDRVFLITGLRYDYHQLYKSDFNYNISLSAIIPVIETRIKANAGSGYKAPTLYQLYDSSNGNTALLPEKNFSYDVGFEQPFFKNMIVFNIVYFNSTYSNLITWVPITAFTGQFKNVDKAYMQGLETELTLRLPYDLNISAGYTFTKAHEAGSDAQLIRKPMHKVFAKLNWSFLKRGNINLTYSYFSERADTLTGAMTTVYTTNAPYHKLDLAASFKIIEMLQVFIRIDNMTDSKYQEANGYYMPGFNAYGGVTVKI